MDPGFANVGAQVSLNRLHETLTQSRPVPSGFRPVRVKTL
ncbi:MAG: hypothetical protein JWN34_618 [Bryobacterales bacterium]|nr:hypothetical protein [Bryobacterales bacterium]